jgi:hypothetical protein
MKLAEFLKSIEVNEAAPSAPPAYIMYAPPSGAAVECPSIETASKVATNFAARHPGKVVGVYAIVGYAFVPIKSPDLTPKSPEDQTKQIEGEGVCINAT